MPDLNRRECAEADHLLPERPRPGTVGFCAAAGCEAMRVLDHQTRRWRRLTSEELITVTAHMIEATAIGQAMTIIHGRERGLARAREVLGYDR